jgi:hypothetical protein
MYFQLMAAMFDFTVTPMSTMSHYAANLLYLKSIGTHQENVVISRSNYDIPSTSGVIAAIMNFCGRGLKTSEKSSCDSLPIGETA